MNWVLAADGTAVNLDHCRAAMVYERKPASWCVIVHYNDGTPVVLYDGFGSQTQARVVLRRVTDADVPHGAALERSGL